MAKPKRSKRRSPVKAAHQATDPDGDEDQELETDADGVEDAQGREAAEEEDGPPGHGGRGSKDHDDRPVGPGAAGSEVQASSAGLWVMLVVFGMMAAAVLLQFLFE